MSEIPRRARIDLNTPAELAIRNALVVVEAAGCHPLLTEAIILLDQAREKVADFVDGPEAARNEAAAAVEARLNAKPKPRRKR